MDIRSRLGLLGYEVAGVATTGEAAIALAESQLPNLVLMDVRLQGAMDGIAAAVEIRRRCHLPVVFLTAYAEDATLQRAKLAEPFGYILKPFEDRELKTVIEMALYKHRTEEEIRHLNRLYAVLSQVNGAIARTGSRQELFDAICRIAVEHGGLKGAWINWWDDATSTMPTVAQCGETAFASSIHCAAGDAADGWTPHTPPPTENGTCVWNDLTDEYCDVPWRQAALDAEVRSVAVALVRHQDRIRGTLGVGADERDYFQATAVNSLEEVALDISFALDNLEKDAQRRRADESVRAAEHQWRTTFDAIGDAVCLVDLDGRIVRANRAMAAQAAGEHPALVGVRCCSPVHGLTEPLPECPLVRMKHSRHRESTVFQRGSRWLEVVVDPLLDETGQLVGAVHITSDITERRRAEEAVAESEEKFRALFEQSSDANFLLEGGAFVDCNNAALQLFRTAREHIVGRTPGDLSPELQPDGRRSAEQAAAHIAGAFRDGHRRFEWMHQCPDATRLEAEVLLTAIRIEGRPILHATVRDVSERNRAEQERQRLQAQLIQAQKLEAIGQGGLTQEVRDGLADIEAEAKRAANLTRQLLMFSRRQVLQTRTFEFNSLLGNRLKMLRRLIGEQIALEFSGAPSDLWLDADPGMIEQVVLNLVVNARDAMPKGGRVTLTMQCLELDETRCAHNPEARPGRFACLAVTDTGHGMDDVTRQRAFEPFFTTKGAGKGTGLGLATVYGIVKQHKGWVEVDSTPGQGTTFRVFLPARRGPPPSEVLPAEHKTMPGGTETILLVEDAESVRRVTASILRQLGYRVVEAGNSQEALALWPNERASVSLLLTDMVMPGDVSGQELLHQLRSDKPSLKCLLVSGYSRDLAESGIAQTHETSFMAKPLEPQALAQRIRACLDGP